MGRRSRSRWPRWRADASIRRPRSLPLRARTRSRSRSLTTWSGTPCTTSSGENKLRVNADDPNQGIIETETNQFTLDDADCGKLKGVSGKYAAEPDRAATVVYYFKVKPKGHEASIVSVQATFSAPLYIPLHTPRDEQCVSRGKAEARLLKQVAEEAAAIHRPTFVKPAS